MDNYEIVILDRAKRDLDEIYSYIAYHFQEPVVALKMMDSLEEQILSLEYMPYRCPERRTGLFANKGYRQLLVKNYNVIFRVDDKRKKVLVVTIRYARSQF